VYSTKCIALATRTNSFSPPVDNIYVTKLNKKDKVTQIKLDY